MRPRKLKVVYRIVGSLAAVYLVLSLLIWFGQTRLIFFPDSVIKTTPDAAGLAYETVSLPVGSGRVHGWWIPIDAAPTVLYLHGNGSNLGDLVSIAAQIHSLGWSAFYIDYRGYGLSEGSFPSEQSVYADAIAALAYLIEVRHIPAQNIVVIGQSLGGAIAIELASRNPNIGAIVVESTFTSIQAIAHYRFPLPLFDYLLHQKFDSLAKVRSLQMPLLVIHGLGDRTVPVQMGQTLYDAAPSPKELLLIPQAGHNNLRRVDRSRYEQTLQKFVQRYITGA